MIVVLITGGKDSGDATYTSANNVAARASQFTSISATGVTGKHVPIHVIGIKVPSAEESQLQSVATNSGGVYHNVTTKADLTAWINYAVQAGYARSADVNAAKPSEFTAVSPIVGTVNLSTRIGRRVWRCRIRIHRRRDQPPSSRSAATSC